MKDCKMQNYVAFSSSSCYKQKRLRCGAVVGSLLMAFSFSIVCKSYFCQLSVWCLESSNMDAGDQISMSMDIRFLQKLESTSKVDVKPLMSNACKPMSNFCEIIGDVMVQVKGNSSTISVVSLQKRNISVGKVSWIVKPYVRKKNNTAAMDLVKNWSVSSADHFLHCDIIRNIPAILFSLGGFSGNHFHDFSDLLIPLYITSRQFNGQVQFLVTDNRPWWITKYQGILGKLSRHDIIDIDRENQMHCYPSITIGLEYHKELGIDQSKSSQDQLSMEDFRKFLRSTYSLKRQNAIRIIGDHGKGKMRPRLLIIPRRNSRSLTNTERITTMAASLGYNVVTVEPNISTSLWSVAQTVNSCDVLMGVHGAGLTNMVFLPDNAILIQIVPLGSIDDLARDDFADPTVDMKLRYLEYKIKAKESSLIRNYKVDDAIIKDPLSVHKKGWDAVRSTYLDKQDVKLDVRRFRSTLLKALELLHE